MARMIRGTPAMTWTLPIEKPGATDTLFSIGVAPCGSVAMRWRAALKPPSGNSAAMACIEAACGSHGTPNASAMQGLVMSSWVGPMPPVVKT